MFTLVAPCAGSEILGPGYVPCACDVRRARIGGLYCARQLRAPFRSLGMNKVQRLSILARAATRMSPRMAIYMARRLARNKLAPRFAQAYHARLAGIQNSLPKLQATPEVVSPGLAVMAEFYAAEYRDMIDGAAEGRIALQGREVDFGRPDAIDWARELPEEGDHQMWRIKLAHMGFLNPMLTEGAARHQAAIVAIIRSAQTGTDPAAPGAFNAYWFPYAASHRILSLVSGLLVARAKGRLPTDVDAALTDLLHENVAFVLDNIEHELCNNHVERNLAALCLYFSYTDHVPQAVADRLEQDISRLVRATLLEDGCQIERSPMYQGLSVASLGVMAEAPFLSQGLRAFLTDTHAKAQKAFAALCHPDGEVALFNDAWHHEVPRWSGPQAPEGRILFAQGGYGRLAQGGDVCILDAGPLGPRWNPGHGHADFLSIELSLGGVRLLVDPGTSRYNTGQERARERSARAHNGPVWLEHEPVDFLGCFKVGRLAGAQLFPAAALPEECIGGFFDTGPGRLARAIQHLPGQGYLVLDLWLEAVKPGQVTWLIPALWHVAPDADGTCLSLRLGGDKPVAARLEVLTPLNAPITPVPAVHAHQYGHVEPAHALPLQPRRAGSEQASLATWIGHGSAPDDVAARISALHETMSSALSHTQ